MPERETPDSGSPPNGERRERHPIRLRGFDYGSQGAYFMTVCTAQRRAILASVVRGSAIPSAIGRIVMDCWLEIPRHFPGTRTGAFQLMPNHVHGIIDILPPVGARHAVPLRSRERVFGAPQRGTLSVIVGGFKSAVSRQCRAAGLLRGEPLWQRGFHDRIIRDGREQYFIERYIALNPLLWHLDRENPAASDTSLEDTRKQLIEEYGLNAYDAECVLEHLS